MRLGRSPQLRAPFVAGDPHSGYYSDLRSKVTTCGPSPADALARLDEIAAVRTRANPVNIIQMGLGAWQLARTEPSWRDVVARVAGWLTRQMEPGGGVPYLFSLRHTYTLIPPWYSSMAQAEAASLLVRAGRMLSEPQLLEAATLAAKPIVDGEHGLVAETDAGPVLQEYPTSPPAHVLNGWITSLWGLYDLASDPTTSRTAYRDSLERGLTALVARLPLYRLALGWSRYDLFPHPVVNVSSPFYHRLHIEQLEATYALTGIEALPAIAGEWRRALRTPVAPTVGVVRKLAFRTLRPRLPSAWLRA